MITRLFSPPPLVKLLLFIYISTSIPVALAYQCEQPRAFAEELAHSSVIFVGKVIEMEFGHKAGTFVNFEVERIYKGAAENTVAIQVDTIGGSGYEYCDVALKIGEIYLVYASGEPLNTNICSRGVGTCSRTQLLANASEDLALLGESTALLTSPASEIQTPEKSDSAGPITNFFSGRMLILLVTIIFALFFIINKIHVSRK